jgi:hypothetical protein
MLAVLAGENPAVRVRIPAKFFRQRRVLPRTHCECAAFGKETSIPEQRWRMPWRRQRTRLAVRPCKDRTRFRFRMMLRMDHVPWSLVSAVTAGLRALHPWNSTSICIGRSYEAARTLITVIAQHRWVNNPDEPAKEAHAIR